MKYWKSETSTCHQLVIAAISIAIVTLAASCVPEDTRAPDPPEPGEMTIQHAIMGGEVDRTHNGVVGMYAMGGGVCSGTLIAPNLVLTAQHCVSEVDSAGVRCGASEHGSTRAASDIYVTPDYELSRSAQFYGASQVIPVPGDGSFCGQDMAVVVLSRNIPSTQAEIIPPRLDVPVAAGEVYTAIGYGVTSDDDRYGQTAGTRRMLTGVEAQCGDCPSYTGVTGTEWLGGDGTCQGDSGGAAIDQQGRVLGALSRGTSGCTNGIYSAVSGWSDWLREEGRKAAQAGGYEALPWMYTGESDDVDGDGILNENDNCPGTHNPEQTDGDGDGEGDACDDDYDNDGVFNNEDNCPETHKPDQGDIDGDGDGDACDPTPDGDDVPQANDNCPNHANPGQEDIDFDGKGDACDDTVNLDDTSSSNNASGSSGSGACNSTVDAGPRGVTGEMLGALLLLGLATLVRRRRS